MPRSPLFSASALQLSQLLLAPSLPQLGIHILLAQVIFVIFFRSSCTSFSNISPRDLFG
jgi:hypothetical protein